MDEFLVGVVIMITVHLERFTFKIVKKFYDRNTSICMGSREIDINAYDSIPMKVCH